MNVISRGYAIVNKDDSRVNSIEELNVGDNFNLMLKDGTVKALVLERSEGYDI